jgi:hypothetical protein
MNTEQKVLIGGAIALVVAAALWEFTAGPIAKGTEITTETLKINGHLPVLWVFYNTSEVNSRQWYDFGARSSRVLNIPLMNLLYNTIAAYSKDEYRIEVIEGVEGVARVLGGWDRLPWTMQHAKAQVTEPEEDWIRNAILAEHGGLWLSSSVICMGKFGVLPKDKVVFFGQDDDGMYGSKIPGFRCVWSPRKGHEIFVEMEERCRARLEGQLGGRQVRGDSKSDWIEIASQRKDIEIRVKAEMSRNTYTTQTLELEDLFAAGTEGRLPFEIPSDICYIRIPYRDLLDRRQWGYVLRMSEEQIMESDIVIKYVLLESKNRHVNQKKQ